MWFNGFQGVKFPRLKELDLRACEIESLSSFQFADMPELEALYLGENVIHTIQTNAFGGLKNLLHLDLSMNLPIDSNGNQNTMLIECDVEFQILQSLKSLDLSYTRMNKRNVAAMRKLGKSLERLSLCNIVPFQMNDRFFKNTSLRILDVSGNFEVLSSYRVLTGLESTLEVLYANDVGLNNFDIFENFKKLQVLSLRRNEITTIRRNTASTLTSLRILDLSRNRLGRWYTPTYSYMPSLEYLDLLNNNINVISEEMMIDFANITYLGLSENSMVCNCRSKDLIELASRNEMKTNAILFHPNTFMEIYNRFGYHKGFEDVNKYITLRKNISYICSEGDCEESLYDGRVLLLDYNTATYSCFQMVEGMSVPLTKVVGCEEERRSDLNIDLDRGRNKLIFLCIVPGILLPSLMLSYVFRKNLRYFYVTMRNSAMISLVNKNNNIDGKCKIDIDICHSCFIPEDEV
jgi:Leucine-rich repeat (LRR) protein